MKQEKNEQDWDAQLNIRTSGRDASAEDENHYPYEPTPYSVLQRFTESGRIDKESFLIDYGSGKGRAAFFLHHETGCRALGIEYNPSFFQEALRNLNDYCGNSDGISFILQDAEKYEVPEEADCFWFFNPFSDRILKAVLARLTDSYYVNPRRITLYFYYASDEYVSELMNSDMFMFDDEIDCSDLFPGKDSRERILIFETLQEPNSDL